MQYGSAPPARPCTAMGYFSRVGQLPLAAPCCPPVPSTSLMAPELRCITGAPLDATEWHAHRALSATEWHKGQHMRSCQEISHHSMPPSGTHIAHSTPPSGTAEPHRPAARTGGGVRAARTTLRRPRPRGCRGDGRRAGRGERRGWGVVRHLRQGRRRSSAQQPEGAPLAYP